MKNSSVNGDNSESIFGLPVGGFLKAVSVGNVVFERISTVQVSLIVVHSQTSFANILKVPVLTTNKEPYANIIDLFTGFSCCNCL